MKMLLTSVLLIHYTSLISISDAAVINEINNGRFYIEDIGFPGAENIAIDTVHNRIYTADGFSIGVNILSFEINPNVTESVIQMEDTIYFEPVFDELFPTENISLFDVTSVFLSPFDYILAAVVPLDYAQTFGWLAFINTTDLSVFHVLEITDCYLPDHVTTTKDGQTIIIACEGEPDDNEVQHPMYNPPGSIALIRVSFPFSVDNIDITNADFEKWDIGGSKRSQITNDVYISYLDQAFSVNVEPEYCVVSDDDKYAYISLQEQNAVAILDITVGEILDVYGLGYIDFGVYGLDASDKDDRINIAKYPNLFGMRAPDSIDYYSSQNGRHYIITANEGDSKKFDESRVKDLVLSENTFGTYHISELQMSENLGRLKVSNLKGKNANNEFETLYAFSSRDFTVFEVLFDESDNNVRGVPNGIDLVYSSQNLFEVITADRLGTDGFNSDYFNPSFDERSSSKGPEPEAIVIGQCKNGKTFVFVAMERANGIFVFDITDIDNEGNVTFVEYFNAQNYSVTFAEDTRPNKSAGDIGPEQMLFVNESVYGKPMLFVAYPESSSVTMYRIECGEYETPIENYEKDSDNNIINMLILVGLSISIGIWLFCTLKPYFIRWKCLKHKQSEIECAKINVSKEDKCQQTALMGKSDIKVCKDNKCQQTALIDNGDVVTGIVSLNTEVNVSESDVMINKV